jgi:hypothetical protein
MNEAQESGRAEDLGQTALRDQNFCHNGLSESDGDPTPPLGPVSSLRDQQQQHGIAFIRYGHGEETIDEYGYQSEDDHRRWYKQQAREQQKNAS